ncbi:hypothetical protein ACT3SZ_12085 [Corynebacterium sp. AOP40-9SA-29]|uniref:hypothetical protein n=1 Tax=Corynebacterium sp. AOP40-9SA-29 TaxID=3457677 RepID=UPI00403453EA
MSANSAQLDAVVDAVGRVPEANFTAYRGGYPKEISTSLLDAVFSMRARYNSTTPGRGVWGRVQNFRAEYPDVINDLAALISIGSGQIEAIMGSTVTHGRPKAVAAIEAAEAFRTAGVNTADDFRELDPKTAKRLYTGVRGLGPETFEYFAMLLGVPGVKVDVMIMRFVARALAAADLSDVSPHAARELVEEAHAVTGLGETLTHFDHALWLSESQR